MEADRILKPLDNNCSSFQHLPPGFRFHPSDEELIVYYLRNRVTSTPLPSDIISDIDLYKFNPWDLPKQTCYGEEEWYYFSPRDRKYPNGTRPNRAAGSGYWKATGTDKPILTSCGTNNIIGVKKALVFYKGHAPKGVKTDWIMHEYRLLDKVLTRKTDLINHKRHMRLDDWVLCRVRQKASNMVLKNTWEEEEEDQNVNRYYKLPVLATKEEQPRRRTSINPDSETSLSSLYKDFPMLSYMFASQDHLPSVSSFDCLLMNTKLIQGGNGSDQSAGN